MDTPTTTPKAMSKAEYDAEVTYGIEVLHLYISQAVRRAKRIRQQRNQFIVGHPSLVARERRISGQGDVIRHEIQIDTAASL